MGQKLTSTVAMWFSTVMTQTPYILAEFKKYTGACTLQPYRGKMHSFKLL
jgi:hypothetical protein